MIYIAPKSINALDSKGNYIVPHRIIRSRYIHWPFVDGWAVTFGTARRSLGAVAPPSPLVAVPNVTCMMQPTHQRPVYQSLYDCYMMVRCSAVLMWRLKGYRIMAQIGKKNQCESWLITWYMFVTVTISLVIVVFSCRHTIRHQHCQYELVTRRQTRTKVSKWEAVEEGHLLIIGLLIV